MLKKDKKPTGVARSKFVDRIKSQSDFQLPQKENLNFNDIRESAYKLPRSKSKTRHDHSLQRKSPIKINENYMQMHPHMKNNSQIMIKQYVSEVPTISNTIKFTYPQLQTQQYYQSQQSNQQISGNFNYDSQISKNIGENIKLRNQQQALDYIKIIWQSTIKLKQKCFYKEQMNTIQSILKEIIIMMAKPKFNSFHQYSHTQNIENLKYSPFNHLKSQSRKVTYRNNIKNIHSKQQNIKQSNNNDSQQSDHEDLQFRKIMYILEEKSKFTKNSSLEASAQVNKFQGERELKQITDILNANTPKYPSSFNCSSRNWSGKTMQEFDKMSNSRSNDKVFLKNIVKKAKNSVSNLEQNENLVQSKHYQISSNNSQEKSRQIISQQKLSGQISEKSQVELQLSQQSLQPSYLDNDVSRKQSHIRIDAAQTLQDDSESKRQVLNQIIGMLNKKYHKNIKLEPRKF